MTHGEHITDRLAAYVDGGLDAGTRERVRAHVESCGACARELEAFRVLERVLDEDVSALPLRSMWPAVAHARNPARRRIVDFTFAAATAAALAGGFMLGVITFDRADRGGVTPLQTTAAATDDWATAAEPSLSEAYFFENGGIAQ
jgi:anti-sigma factor RsiW